MVDVTAIGELLVDFTQIKTEDDNGNSPIMQANAGGAPANFLAALSKFGVKTAMLAAVGDDLCGKMLVQKISDIGIETSGIKVTDKAFTTLAFVALDKHGDRSFAFARKPGADTQLVFDELNLKLIDECKVFHFGTLSLTTQPSRETTKMCVEYAHKKGKLVSLDPNLRLNLWDSKETAKKEMLWSLLNADIVKISLEEIEFLFNCDEKEGAQIILKEYNSIIVFVTLGKNGCYFANLKTHGYVENFNDVKTIDTTGAGDIFGGSAMYMLLRQIAKIGALEKDELEKVVRFACAAASLSTEKNGGIASVPELCDVKKLANI